MTPHQRLAPVLARRSRWPRSRGSARPTTAKCRPPVCPAPTAGRSPGRPAATCR